MKLNVYFSNRLRLAYSKFSNGLAKHWTNKFYLYLAAIFMLFAVLDTVQLHIISGMRQEAFDAMVRYRIIVPKPDSDIVIVDINEASLSAMAKDYGRWPWPRLVLGEFLEQVEKQQPKAIVFDILFSDPDIYNPDSDAYFDSAIAATNNAYFPLLRLDPSNDALSMVKPAMIPGVVPLLNDAQPEATIAVVLPHFPAALKSGRLGLHNIYPDADGVARQYIVYRGDYGWKLPSLPASLARDFGWPEPAAQSFLLNWRGPPFSYQYTSFHDVYTDMGNKEKKRPQDEFKNKIVIIGSTAPSLFDIKPTPMSQMHPGVEILATAIDNLKHDDYLRFPDASVAYLLLTLCIIWATAWAFYRNFGRNKIGVLFGASQFVLIGISYASINFTNTYINITGPVTIGLAFFTIARLYSAATNKMLERSMVRASLEREGKLQVTLLLIRLDGDPRLLTDTMLDQIRYKLENAGLEQKSVDIIRGYQKGLWDLFEKTFSISWIVDEGDVNGAARVAEDVAVVTAAFPQLLRKFIISSDIKVSWFVHQGEVLGGKEARNYWRGIFAETLLRWNEQQEKTL
ncbi:Sensor domain CHASE2-containing protein [Candidatus Nitrotoga sp. BS]|uniref:CHASE2 domain-containing protein n=1 Tax=Candidatus Nitrotoga sp. BS TaxID=2890408 RepID=UPI001EF34CAD|nr:CHASE2 domain-containing protein [Candidatus Nitrotoga sp. BS]CAH1211766.1 Sensor domain CHASE2-containing protein [Candidatus Nitrotoga sp. BS]